MEETQIFLWDEKKNATNKEKHGLSFETAILVFNDPNYIDIYDEKHSINEERHLIIGLVNTLLCVVCVFNDKTTRIISCRVATKEEEKYYYGHNSCSK